MESKGTKPTRAREGIYRETPSGVSSSRGQNQGLAIRNQAQMGSSPKESGSNRGPALRNQAQIWVRRAKSGGPGSKSGVRGLGTSNLGLSALGIPGSELLAANWATQASVPRGGQSYLHECTARSAYTQQ